VRTKTFLTLEFQSWAKFWGRPVAEDIILLVKLGLASSFPKRNSRRLNNRVWVLTPVLI